MSKQTKNTKEKSPKKDLQLKSKANGFYSLVLALAEVATVYIFVTQDNRLLLPLAVVFGVDASVRFSRAFIK